MSYGPNQMYPGATELDPNYPKDKFKDNNPSTTNNGTPLKAIKENQDLTLETAIMNDAGFKYNGLPDTPQDSQLFKAYKASLGNGANLLSNHNFLIQTPDDSQPLPDATPRSYPPGYQIFSGVFANETTGITNLTYIDGRVSFSGGDLYFAVPNTGAIARLAAAQLTASVADFDGKPRTRGVSFALVGDDYRVTVGVNALEDVSAVLTPLGSVKFEQGSVATGHEAFEVEVVTQTVRGAGSVKNLSNQIKSTIKGQYEIIPLGENDPIYLSTIRLTELDHSPGELLVKAGEDYEQGKLPGEYSRNPIIRVQSNDYTLWGGSFDGNGQYTQSGYNPSIVNVNFEPVKFQNVGNKIYHGYAIGFKSKGSGAAAVQFADSEHCMAALGYGERGTAAAAFGGGDVNARILGYLGVNQYDAHFVFNTTDTGSCVATIANGGVNGTCTDLSGNDLLYAANIGKNMPKAGVQIIQSPNSNAEYSRVHAASNLLFNNTRSPSFKQGEIQIGTATDEGTGKQGERASATANQINVVNSTDPSQSEENSSVFVGYNTEKTVLNANVLFGNLDSDRLPATFQIEGADSVIVADNHSLMDSDKVALASWDSCTGRQKWVNNSYARVGWDSPQVPTDMIERDGYWEYSIKRNISSTSQFDIITIEYPGGFEFDDIEVTVSQGGDRGITKKSIVARGNSGATSAILRNEDIYSLGTNPPVVDVVAPASSGTVDIKCTPFSTGLFTFHVRIIPSNDDPSRFIPKFI